MDNKEKDDSIQKLDWKQGLAIASGVPLLILPSIGYFAKYMGALAILVWMLSVLQGFVQNLAYAELATMFTRASGLPGFSQTVFRGNRDHKYDYGKFTGGFSAWGYWFAWSPAMAIFTLLIGTYLKGLIPAFNNFSETGISTVVGILLYSFLFIINFRGLSGSAVLGYILAIIALAPLIIISILPIFLGYYDIDRITGSWLPMGWVWDSSHILILLGLMAMAQWSACAWETASMYAPEYKNPRTDVPKALFLCGSICLISFVLVQTTCTATIGIDGIVDEPFSPLISVANITMGPTGKNISIIMLIAAMLLIIQTAFLGSSRALYSMAQEGNLPKVFAKVNSHGMPVIAMMVVTIFNLALISLKTPSGILAASSLGYVITNSLTLFAFFKTRISPEFKSLEKPFRAPKIWHWIAFLFGVLNLPLYLIGIIYLNSLDIGWKSTWIGLFVLLVYIPLWLFTQGTARKKRMGLEVIEE